MNLSTDLDHRWSPALSQPPKPVMAQRDPTSTAEEPSVEVNRLESQAASVGPAQHLNRQVHQVQQQLAETAIVPSGSGAVKLYVMGVLMQRHALSHRPILSLRDRDGVRFGPGGSGGCPAGHHLRRRHLRVSPLMLSNGSQVPLDSGDITEAPLNRYIQQ